MIQPGVLGLPPKFSTWRNEQYRAFIAGQACEKYAFLIDAPTGIGKSLIGAAFQAVSKTTHIYLVNTKQLQDQILHDFPYAKTLKGRSNYKCLKFPHNFPEISANECIATDKFPCEHQFNCPYMAAKMAALSAPLAVLNYSYFLYETNYSQGKLTFSRLGPVIADEVDALEEELMGFISLVITKKQLDAMNIDPPTHKTKFEAWQEWAVPAISYVKEAIEKLEQETSAQGGWGTVDFRAMKKLQQYKRLFGKLEFFQREVNNTWVWYPSEEQWEFKPVWVSKYALGIIWKHIPKLYGMSATILDPKQLDKNIGLSNGFDRQYDYIAMSSPFLKENRPIYYQPVAAFSHKNMQENLPKLCIAVDRILDSHKNDKVLIHTVSYAIAKYLFDNATNKRRMLMHNTFNRTDVLNTFKSSKQPMVLVSPSMQRGVDLPQDECRAVIIAKLPYPNLGDPQIRKRLYGSGDGKSWYAHKTVSSIIQMAGRGVRSVDDYASTYILDEQFGRLYSDNPRLFPAWFKEAIVR